MPKHANFDESRLAEACTTALAQKRPNIANIAREFDVSRTTLSDRVKKAKAPTTPTESMKNALTSYQERALVAWIQQMCKDRQVGKMWAYRFMARIPAHLNLAPVKQKTKELRRIQAEDAGLLQHYDQIVANLSNQIEIPELQSDLRPYSFQTLSPPPTALSSSSVEITPPKSIEALLKNQTKITKYLDTFLPKMQRDITKIFDHQREKLEELHMTQDTIQRIRAAQEPLRRQYTKRQVKPLSQSGVLKASDANRSIRARKAKDMAAEERKLAKQFEKIYGYKPTQRPEEAIRKAAEAKEAATRQGELFFYDN
ncbi:transposase [Penicillium canariense]|uniref:Transposase n=1 Tax=Penicillium canariense TaxID=189055 RepID=A0A9W9HNB5_9EURO|nr:transposase [Penicillium canariense]KAJ5151516.1 transposase [Penicillium canariense]